MVSNVLNGTVQETSAALPNPAVVAEVVLCKKDGKKWILAKDTSITWWSRSALFEHFEPVVVQGWDYAEVDDDSQGGNTYTLPHPLLVHWVSSESKSSGREYKTPTAVERYDPEKHDQKTKLVAELEAMAADLAEKNRAKEEAVAALKDVETRFRKTLESLGELSQGKFEHAFGSATMSESNVLVEDKGALVFSMATAIPGLLSDVVSVNRKALTKLLDENPAIKALLPALPREQAISTTVFFSKLPNGNAEAEEVETEESGDQE